MYFLRLKMVVVQPVSNNQCTGTSSALPSVKYPLGAACFFSLATPRLTGVASPSLKPDPLLAVFSKQLYGDNPSENVACCRRNSTGTCSCSGARNSSHANSYLVRVNFPCPGGELCPPGVGTCFWILLTPFSVSGARIPICSSSYLFHLEERAPSLWNLQPDSGVASLWLGLPPPVVHVKGPSQ